MEWDLPPGCQEGQISKGEGDTLELVNEGAALCF